MLGLEMLSKEFAAATEPSYPDINEVPLLVLTVVALAHADVLAFGVIIQAQAVFR